MDKIFNVFYFELNGIIKETIPLFYQTHASKLAEGFKTSYRLSSGYGNWEMFFYAESKMNNPEKLKTYEQRRILQHP